MILVEKLTNKFLEKVPMVTVLTYNLDNLKILEQAVLQLKSIFGKENEYKFRFKENIRESSTKLAFGYTFSFN